MLMVNINATSHQHTPSMAALIDGGFPVTWHSDGQDGLGYSIYGQRFNAGGNRLGSEFQFNTFTTSSQSFTSATASSDGGFAVSWESLWGSIRHLRSTLPC